MSPNTADASVSAEILAQQSQALTDFTTISNSAMYMFPLQVATAV